MGNREGSLVFSVTTVQGGGSRASGVSSNWNDMGPRTPTLEPCLQTPYVRRESLEVEPVLDHVRSRFSEEVAGLNNRNAEPFRSRSKIGQGVVVLARLFQASRKLTAHPLFAPLRYVGVRQQLQPRRDFY